MGGGISAARALQRDAQGRCRAYWAAHHERAADPKALRERLRLTRKAMEAAAKKHIEASAWMRYHLTKAIGLHVADEVWKRSIGTCSPTHSAPARPTADRVVVGVHPDSRAGPLHTKARPVWETWRLVGTLDGHLQTYRDPELPEMVTTCLAAVTQPAGTSILAQPARLPTPSKPAGSWWEHDGQLAVVFTGLPGGDVVLPVRLPQGAGQWAHLAHFLADPTTWHKIDLVRVRDRHAPGGWRYYAHLLTHHSGYETASTLARRGAIPRGRRAGVDANVSNLSLASFPDQRPNQPVIEQITLTDEQQAAAERASTPRPRAAARVGSIAAQQQPRPIRALGAPGSNAVIGAARAGCGPNRSPILAAPGPPATTTNRCARTGTTRSRTPTTGHGLITPSTRGCAVKPSWRGPATRRRRS